MPGSPGLLISGVTWMTQSLGPGYPDASLTHLRPEGLASPVGVTPTSRGLTSLLAPHLFPVPEARFQSQETLAQLSHPREPQLPQLRIGCGDVTCWDDSVVTSPVGMIA